MTAQRLILVLGDQLSDQNPALRNAVPGKDTILMAEVAEEANYVRHNRHKIALIFSAMRHFAARLEEAGFKVIYFRLAEDLPSLEAATANALAMSGATLVSCCEPGEYRLKAAMECWPETLGVAVDILEDTRFLSSNAEFAAWADGRKQLRMEYFYREMRRRYGVLLEPDGKPAGDKWNYDSDNRKGWRAQEAIPARPDVDHDAVTAEVLREVEAAFPNNPGDLSRFCYAVTPEGAQQQLDWFCQHALPLFGTYQDGMAEESPWLFHSLISMYLNVGLLEPLPVCQQVEGAWREGQCSLAAAEGFIRQVLGWREYVRGIYWLMMPDYKTRNMLEAELPLPAFFWDAQTDMRCLSQALSQSLDLGYGHHIQRLMVIGNFALLAGLSVDAVCDWFLAVYVDAFEWVELPNTLGMALHADGGVMASKPYAASGKYIQRQGNHCAQCVYNPAKTTGEGACPYNSLYWRFIDRHSVYLKKNARMGLVLANWDKRSSAEKRAIVDWGDRVLAEVVSGPD